MPSLSYSQRVVSPTVKVQEWSCVFCSYVHTAENNENTFHCCKLCQTARCHFSSTTQPPTMTTNRITASSAATVTPIMHKTTSRAAKVSPSPRLSSSFSSSPRDSVKHSPWVAPSPKKKNIMPRSLDFDPKEMPLDEWLATVRPSQMSSMDCEWISIQRTKEEVIVSSASTSSNGSDGGGHHHRVTPPTYRRALRQITNQLANTVMSPTKSRVFAAVKKKNNINNSNSNNVLKNQPQNAIATSPSSNLSEEEAAARLGKWMFFVSTDDADAIWERVARATVRGELGSAAKIAPAAQTTTTTIFTSNRSILSSDRHRPILCCVYVKDFTRRDQVKRVLEMILKLFGNHVRASFKPDFYGDFDPDLYKKEQVLAWNDVVAATNNDDDDDDDQRNNIA